MKGWNASWPGTLAASRIDSWQVGEVGWSWEPFWGFQGSVVPGSWSFTRKFHIDLHWQTPSAACRPSGLQMNSGDEENALADMGGNSQNRLKKDLGNHVSESVSQAFLLSSSVCLLDPLKSSLLLDLWVMLDSDNGEDMKSFDIYMTYPENPATRRSVLGQRVGRHCKRVDRSGWLPQREGQHEASWVRFLSLSLYLSLVLSCVRHMCATSKLFIHTWHLSRTWNACCWLRTSRWPTVVFLWWSPSLRLGLYQAATDVKGRRWSFPSGFPSGHCENFRCFKVRYSKSYLNNSLGSLKELKMTYFPNKNWEAFSESENSRIFQLTGVLAFPCPRTRWMPTTSWHNSLWKVLLILSGGGWRGRLFFFSDWNFWHKFNVSTLQALVLPLVFRKKAACKENLNPFVISKSTWKIKFLQPHHLSSHYKYRDPSWDCRLQRSWRICDGPKLLGCTFLTYEGFWMSFSLYICVFMYSHLWYIELHFLRL